MSEIKNVKLNNGVLMPQQGFGVFQITDKELCKKSVKEALNVGYRAIDTAQAYFNENYVGDAIKESDIDRKDIFLTTKVWPKNYGYQNTLDSVEESMKKLNTDYLDLVILHQPLNDYYGAYRALEKLYDEQKIRAIGISNFNTVQYADLVMNMKVVPAINQVETHVFNQETGLREYMDKHNTHIESWAPLAEGKNNFFNNNILNMIGQYHEKSAAQVALRFLVQSGIIIIPKSTHIERMKQNMEVWNFKLNDYEMKAIQDLDLDKSLFFDYSDPKQVERLNNFEV
ncbi:aldo/keto reductase [Apilactobacillus quenuiae]|uniref:aldo/keto reductase n=1 Tax=Apilactobacillus quenuiae TaxID=2008377 RepID=UPI001CDABC9E|nr:aldo/keto reductase [Apilactobacillus quenuiae]